MTDSRPRIELLAPAKNADFGIAAIDHGADAVYIGGPSFGARANAGNSLTDIARLADHAHRFNARVLVALNTLLKDEELETARRLAWQCYEAGADALILQDMGLLELDLPPIQLHASTQTDIRTPEKARFLQDVGFSQIVLARELSLAQIRDIAAQTTIPLEFFVHGALCVSYSGLCNLSHATTGRSANRGDCSQACRLPYTLSDAQGGVIAENKHLLSLKDNDQSDNLRALIDAGIRSFKIEGRLKDLSYVKNITAYYRQRLDAELETLAGFRRASSGRTTHHFVPQPEKTFNRGATDYFVNTRHVDVGAFDSPKFTGEPIGTVLRLGRDFADVDTRNTLNNGDGIAYYDAHGELVGLRINRVEKQGAGYRLYPALSGGRLPDDLAVGTALYRNRDQEFERQLEKTSAERRITLRLRLYETTSGYALSATDDEGIVAQAEIEHPLDAARDAARAEATLREGLGKLGTTIYCAESIEIDTRGPRFLPAAVLNGLRRALVDALETARRAAYRRPARAVPLAPPPPYPQETLDYLGNVFNARARAFYEKHGVRVIAPAFECQQERGEVSLMITKHCLRYSFNLCPKQVKGLRPDPLVLINGKEKLTLRFDCKPCEMHVVGKLGKRALQLKAVPGR